MELREKLSTFKLSPHLFLCLQTRKIKGVVLEPPSKLVPPKWYQGLIANVPPMFLGIMLMLFFLVSTRLVSDKKYPRASYPKNMFLLICFYYVKREVHFILFLSLLFYQKFYCYPFSWNPTPTRPNISCINMNTWGFLNVYSPWALKGWYISPFICCAILICLNPSHALVYL